jgi:hypothetical protein
MNIDKTTRLISTRSEMNANQLLTAGWTLLLVADQQQGEHQWQYVFGWQRETEPAEITFHGFEDGPDPIQDHLPCAFYCFIMLGQINQGECGEMSAVVRGSKHSPPGPHLSRRTRNRRARSWNAVLPL